MFVTENRSYRMSLADVLWAFAFVTRNDFLAFCRKKKLLACCCGLERGDAGGNKGSSMRRRAHYRAATSSVSGAAPTSKTFLPFLACVWEWSYACGFLFVGCLMNVAWATMMSETSE